MSTENLNKIIAFTWFSNLPYSKQVEYCEMYFNEKSPDDLYEDDIEAIYNWEVTSKEGIVSNNSIFDREVFNKEDMRLCYEAGIKMGESYIANHGYDNYIDFETYINNIAR